MEQTYERKYVFRKHLCFTTQSIAWLHHRLSVWTEQRISLYLKLTDSTVWAYSLEEMQAIPDQVLRTALQISFRFFASAFNIDFNFFNNAEHYFNSMPSYAEINTAEDRYLYILQVVCDELTEMWKLTNHQDCIFVARPLQSDQHQTTLPISEKFQDNTRNAGRSGVLQRTESIHKGSVRLTVPAPWSNDSLSRLSTVFEKLGLSLDVTLCLETGEERSGQYHQGMASDEELSSAPKLDITAFGDNVTGDHVILHQILGEPSQFYIAARTAAIVEERRTFLAAFAEQVGLLKSSKPEVPSPDTSQGRTAPKQSQAKLTSPRWIVSTVITLALLYFTMRQTNDADTQAHAVGTQTSAISHSDQADLIVKRSNVTGKQKNSVVLNLDIQNVGKAAALDVRVRCGMTSAENPILLFGPVAVQQEVTKSVTVDLSDENPLRSAERSCLRGTLFAAYRDGQGMHRVKFDSGGSPLEDLSTVWDPTSDNKFR